MDETNMEITNIGNSIDPSIFTISAFAVDVDINKSKFDVQPI